MEYQIGDRVQGWIIKIQKNGCLCYLGQERHGFMPYDLMPSFIDDNGRCVKAVNEIVDAVIYNINDKGFIFLSDEMTFEKFRENEAKIQKFVSLYEPGTIFEAEVNRVLSNKVIITLGGFEGVIAKKDTNWNEIDSMSDQLFEGETINAVFLKEENGQLYFSLKLLNEKPYDEDLYDLSLDDLLRFVGHESNLFVGKAKQYHYGLFIENLYSLNDNQIGKLLIDPIYGYNLRALVFNSDFNIEAGKYYKVALRLSPKHKRLERNQLFQFFAVNIEETTNPYKTDVSLAFQRNTTNPTANQRDAKLLDEIGKNMYSSKDRMFFELIQNADDAASQKGVLINVRTNGGYLIIRHNGNSFDREDFVSITTAANGTKKANENKIGYKGIGFKSVFTDSERVFINTGGYQFKFDKKEPIFQDFDKFYLENNPMIMNEETKKQFLLLYADYKKQFDGIHSIPWQLEPIWVDDFPNELGEDFDSANVAIALELGESRIEGTNGYCQAIENIISNPKFMLFLRNTNRIDFNGKSVSKKTKDGTIILKNSFNAGRIEYFKRTDFEIEVSDSAFEESGIDIRIKVDEQDVETGEIIEARFVDLQNQEFENIPKKIAINNSSIVSFAIPITENGGLRPDTKCSDISLFAFLPTLVKDFRFPIYINSNFILDPPRLRILGDNPWNFYLMQEIAKCMVRWCASLCEKHDKNALNILISHYFDEGSTDTKQLAEHFNSAYKDSLESEAFVLNHRDVLSKQDEIILDTQGLSQLIGPDLFCKIMKTDKCLPSMNIDSKILEKEIFERIEKPDLEDILKAVTGNFDFNAWFISAEGEQKESFFKWINRIKEKGNEFQAGCLDTLVLNLPLFKYGEKTNSFKEAMESSFNVTTKHIAPIKDILKKLNYICSDNIFDESHPLYGYIKMPNEAALYEAINKCDFSGLDVSERIALFIALKDFSGVGDSKLKEIALFKNKNGEFKPLGEMGYFKEGVSKWLFPYVLCESECCEELSGYLITDDDFFTKIVWKHKDEYPDSLFDFYVEQKWTDEKYTQQIIRENKGTDKFKELLPIVECYGRESDAKKIYLQYVDKLELSQNAVYDKNSYEYRVLRLALSVYEEPTVFSSKVYFGGQCIKDFSVSDDVICDFCQSGEKRIVKMSLAKLLPRYQNLSDQKEKMKECFDIEFDDREQLNGLFCEKPKPIEEILRELENKDYLGLSPGEWVYNKGGNALQYLFYVYFYREKKKYISSWVISIKLENETKAFVFEMLDFLYENKIDIRSAPFTYRVNHYFIGKYLNNHYIIDKERILSVIEQWADTVEKKQYLFQNGVKDETDKSIQFRKLFMEDRPFSDKLSDNEWTAGINYVATSDGCDKPFVGENQKKILLSLRKNEECKLNTEVNWSKLNEEAAELGIPEYKTWIEDHNLHIYIYDGLMPKLLFYNNVLLLNFEEKHHAYDKSQQRLFVEKDTIQQTLLKAIDDKDIPFDASDYSSLFSIISKEDYETLKGENEELKKKVEELKKQLEIYDEGASDTNSLFKSSAEVEGQQGTSGFLVEESENDERQHAQLPTIKSGISSPIGEKEQWEAQLEAQKRLMQEFPQWTFPGNYGEGDANGKPYNFSTIEIMDEDDNTISIVLKSYKKADEPFKINTEEWDYLIKEQAVLLIYTGADIKRVYVRDLIRKQSCVTITFSTENLDVEDKVNAFADSLHYFYELHFDFESFNISHRVQSAAELYNRNKRAFFANDNTEDDI